MKVRVTLPPPGMVKLLQLGTAAPAAGLVVEGRVAPPASVTDTVELYVKFAGSVSEIARLVAALRLAAFDTTIAYVAVVPAGVLMTVGVLVLFVVVITGTHCAPELAPGIWLAVIERTEPVEPAVAPYGSLAVVVIPLAPPFTLVVADP